MNIWLLHPFAGGPAGLGRHWRPFWLADAWTRMGHRPLVVSARFHHLHQAPQAAGPQRIGNVDFWFLETPRYGDGSLGRLWNNLSFGPRFQLNATRISEQFGKPDLVIASTPHLFFVSAAAAGRAAIRCKILGRSPRSLAGEHCGARSTAGRTSPYEGDRLEGATSLSCVQIGWSVCWQMQKLT